MSRKSMFEMQSPRSSRTMALTRLFDLLLLGGYIACGLLTYYLLMNGALAKQARQSAQAAPAAPAIAAEAPAAEAPEAEAPAASPAAAAATPPPSTEPPAPPIEPGGKDLTAAMNAYVQAVNKGEYVKARAMRADPNVPSVDGLRKTKAMKLVSVVAYPRISRTQGSIYVKLRIEKGGKPLIWKGRIDWENRTGKWVTVKWDSQAASPDSEEPAATH
jgi:hypothetical protein